MHDGGSLPATRETTGAQHVELQLAKPVWPPTKETKQSKSSSVRSMWVQHNMPFTLKRNRYNVVTALQVIVDIEPKSNIQHTMNNDLNRYIKTLQYKLVRPWKPQCSNLGIHRHCPNNKTGHNPFCQHPWIQDQLVNAKTQMANNHMKLSDCTGMAKL